MNWQPSYIAQFVEARKSSTQVVVVETDVGRGFLKAINNPEGPHALACDWVGTQLADWFGLKTLKQAFVEVDEIVELRCLNGDLASPGPALISRAVLGEPWSGHKRQLKKLGNPDDLTSLVVFDTWILNWDRYFNGRINTDNVFFSFEDEQVGLLAIDHTHCFGARGELTDRVAHLSNIQDNSIYGLFPEFRPYLKQTILRRAIDRLGRISEAPIDSILTQIPREWDVSLKAKSALKELILRRAEFVAETIESRLRLYSQQEISFTEESEEDQL